MPLSATFELDGSAGPLTTTNGATVALSLVNRTGIRSINWEVFGYYGAGITEAPDITKTGSPSGVTATLELPSVTGTLGAAFGIRCTVTDNNNETAISTAGVYVLNSKGSRPGFPGETFEDDSEHGWTGKFNTALAGEASDGASEITYDNGTSGLAAENVQDALDEIVVDLANQNDADEINYDNASSGLTADNVQAAIDEQSETLINVKIDSGSSTVVVGASTPELNDLGSANTILGHGAGAAFEGSSALFIGTNAAPTATGSGQTIIGNAAGTALTSGNGNVIVASTASTLTTGSGNLLLGIGADVPTASTSSFLNLGTVFTGVIGSNKGAVGDSSRVLTSQTAAFAVYGDGYVEEDLEVYGAITCENSNGLTFKNTEANGGTPTLKVAPEDTAQVSSLTTGSNSNYDFDPGANGYFQFSVNVVLKLASAGTYRRVSAVIDAVRSSGTLTVEGIQTNIPGGTATGVTLTLSATSGSLRCNVDNATGETVNGYVQIGWLKTNEVA